MTQNPQRATATCNTQVKTKATHTNAPASPVAIQNLDEDALNYALLQAQSALREARNQPHARGLLVLVNGMEQSGKGDAVKALSEWLDARYLKVHATMGQHPSDYQPIWQRHTAQLPRHGEVTIYFGNWYADLIRYYFDNSDQLDHARLSQMMADIEAFEQDLINNNTDIIKCWFSVDGKVLEQRLDDNPTLPEPLYHLKWHKAKHRKRFEHFSNHLLDKQPTWHIIHGDDPDASNLRFAQLVLGRLQQVNADIQSAPKTPGKKAPSNDEFVPSAIPAALLKPDNTTLDKADYKKQLDKHQRTLAKLLAKRGRRHIVLVFEGMDAAGKGGAIKRVIAPLDPREFAIHPIGAPTEDELKHPYLWRFWTRLPHDELADVDLSPLRHHHPKAYQRLINHAHDSRLTIFDRSWYGRVLVERIEKFAEPHEWQRAYEEINRFEQDLTQSGAIVIKFWLAISNEEELKRFNAREDTPHKQYKITDEDWRNRSQWDAYVQAASDMIARTHHEHCPWHIIATDDKYTARLRVLTALIAQLSTRL